MADLPNEEEPLTGKARLEFNREVVTSIREGTYEKLSPNLLDGTSIDFNTIEIICVAHGLAQVLNANKSLLAKYAKEKGYESIRDMPNEEQTSQIREVLFTVLVSTIALQKFEEAFYELKGVMPDDFELGGSE